jgi:imidazolonepropionase-like amidohydrolase
MKNRLIHIFLLFSPVLAFAQAVPTPAKPQTQVIVIQNVTIHTGTGTVLEKGSLVFEKGKITQIGTDLKTAANAKIIDASGKHVYPGLITVNSNLGLLEVESVRATNDQSETGAINSNARAIVSYNTDSKVIPTVRSNGVLLAQIAPNGGIFSGTSAVVQLDAWNWEDAAVVQDDAVYVNYPNLSLNLTANEGANYVDEQRKNIEKQENLLHQTLKDAINYKNAKENGENVSHNQMLEALVPILKQEKRLFVRASSENQIVAAVALAQQYQLKIVIVGGQDAYLQTDLLKKYNIPVVLFKPHQLPRTEDDDIDMPYKLPSILQKAGIVFCFDMDEFWNERNLAFQAGTAAAYGLTKEEALASISANPAKILGIDKRVGTLEIGKDATLLISEGDILDMRTSRVTNAFIEGREIDLGNMQTDLYKKFSAKYK